MVLGSKKRKEKQDLKDKNKMIEKFNQQIGWDKMTAQEKFNAMKNMVNDKEVLKVLERSIRLDKNYYKNDQDFKDVMENPQLYIDDILETTTLSDIENNKLGALVLLLVAIKLKNNSTGGRRRRRKSLRKRRKSKKRRKKTKKRRRRRRR
jgi:short subunit dehydrogenase-like uncharacterized protein